MADVFDKEKRSSIMQCVRSKGNKSTEIKLIQVFAENGITGWRRNYQVKGHPDFVFPKRKIAVFVDGCFWHGHDCRNTRPSDNQEYWQKKRERKSSLKTRMDASKTFVLIVGDQTASVTAGSCRWCGSYNSYTYRCAKGYSVDYRSFIKFECDKAVEAGIKIIVLYKATRVDRSKCPEAVRYVGTHASMIYKGNDGNYYWDYQSVKDAFDA